MKVQIKCQILEIPNLLSVFDMDEIKRSILLSKYEKIIGKSSDMFHIQCWAAFDLFVEGYNLKERDLAECLLSVYDSAKLYDNKSLDLTDETFSEVLFRKMRGFNIDLNEELGFDHLKPVKRKET